MVGRETNRKNAMFGHFSGLYCQMTKQFSKELDVRSWDSSLLMGEYRSPQVEEH